mmetsp:Transcript_49565/g.118033  ORF Transcript_49565/g.118033 Transcript_49565/m.118033 type:complete len:325 (-) Transcript_49565:2475-3449(-)
MRRRPPNQEWIKGLISYCIIHLQSRCRYISGPKGAFTPTRRLLTSNACDEHDSANEDNIKGRGRRLSRHRTCSFSLPHVCKAWRKELELATARATSSNALCAFLWWKPRASNRATCLSAGCLPHRLFSSFCGGTPGGPAESMSYACLCGTQPASSLMADFKHSLCTRPAACGDEALCSDGKSTCSSSLPHTLCRWCGYGRVCCRTRPCWSALGWHASLRSARCLDSRWIGRLSGDDAAIFFADSTCSNIITLQALRGSCGSSSWWLRWSGTCHCHCHCNNMWTCEQRLGCLSSAQKRCRETSAAPQPPLAKDILATLPSRCRSL